MRKNSHFIVYFIALSEFYRKAIILICENLFLTLQMQTALAGDCREI